MTDTPNADHLAVISDHLAHQADDLPRWQSLRDALSDAIVSGSLRPDARLPSERALADGLGLSRVTVRRAIEELVRSRHLARRHGARTTVARRVEKTLSRLSGFSEDIMSRGMRPGLRWLSRDVALPTPTEVMSMGIAPDEPIIRLRRVRLADGEPIALECATVPQALLRDPVFEGESLYAALEALGVRPVTGTQRIRAGVMSRSEAELLASSPGDALLIVERRCLASDGRPVEFTETRYSGERYDFVTELTL
ncbi:GntR family transcriptional regulator [Palleronia aestuarii]|uniref:GntR family transcriptional regulator n=1 Tax=Palleronia aestuarii TaxID=568105 RepID=A0A2W7MVP6_9RHOB|nr:GntR family transcriptional regulator [Palleronia aestuarii]PZX11711.1 GntR family transcriptional regulator [Palleronia aestuarii]